MKIADVIIQSMLMLGALASLLLGREGLVWIALIQFLIGAWQLLSAIIHSFHRDTKEKKKMLLIYWMAVIAYFIVLGLTGMFGHEPLQISWFFCAWIIAVYYYVFCLRQAFYKENGKRTFLDVAN